MWHVSSGFLARDRTPAPALGAQGLSSWTTRDVPRKSLKMTHTQKKTSKALNAINRSTSGSDTLGWENEQGNPRSKRGLVLFFPKEHILLNQAEKDIQNGIL